MSLTNPLSIVYLEVGGHLVLFPLPHLRKLPTLLTKLTPFARTFLNPKTNPTGANNFSIGRMNVPIS